MYNCNKASQGDQPGSKDAQSRFTTAKIMLQQVSEFYHKANILMVAECRACDEIVILRDNNNKHHSNDKSRHNTQTKLYKLEAIHETKECTKEYNDSPLADEDKATNADGKAKQMNKFQQNKPTGTITFIPNLVVLATRLKMTPMQQATFVQTVIVEWC